MKYDACVKYRIEETFSPGPYIPKVSKDGNTVKRGTFCQMDNCENRGTFMFTVLTVQCFAAKKFPKYLGPV